MFNIPFILCPEEHLRDDPTKSRAHPSRSPRTQCMARIWGIDQLSMVTVRRRARSTLREGREGGAMSGAAGKGGTEPEWKKNGQDLYHAQGRVMTVGGFHCIYLMDVKSVALERCTLKRFSTDAGESHGKTRAWIVCSSEIGQIKGKLLIQSQANMTPSSNCPPCWHAFHKARQDDLYQSFFHDLHNSDW